ncbi:unnamed protein product [Trichogramma brassicae]|uniref:Uncharacterized protein n=1 Tax=Trichogramma brassicae TaxID=86971 RepID=A0A6H5I7Z7_9HYME|nr:unnamed protein product [Trichogramma brassicae]
MGYPVAHRTPVEVWSRRPQVLSVTTTGAGCPLCAAPRTTPVPRGAGDQRLVTWGAVRRPSTSHLTTCAVCERIVRPAGAAGFVHRAMNRPSEVKYNISSDAQLLAGRRTAVLNRATHSMITGRKQAYQFAAGHNVYQNLGSGEVQFPPRNDKRRDSGKTDTLIRRSAPRRIVRTYVEVTTVQRRSVHQGYAQKGHTHVSRTRLCPASQTPPAREFPEIG